MAARINKKRSFLFVSKVLGKHIPVDPYTPLLTGAALGLLLYRRQWDRLKELEEARMQGSLYAAEAAAASACGQEQAGGGAGDAGYTGDTVAGLPGAAAGHSRPGATLGEAQERLAEADRLLETAVRGLSQPQLAREAYTELAGAKLVLPEPVLFIGYAETATALGHSMFRLFHDGASYIHTTREDIPELVSAISFEEEHSHAVDHLCYALDPELLSGGEPVVLVDDEITTGNTVVNTIRDMQSKFPRSDYVVASILDWRTGANREAYAALEQELGIRITSLCLLEGSIEVSGAPLLEASVAPSATSSAAPAAAGESTDRVPAPVNLSVLQDGMDRLPVSSRDSLGEVNAAPYIRGSGRFGIRSSDNEELDLAAVAVASRLQALREGARALVLGTGEFMYLPMRIAAAMGEGVSYQSTTRSPIYPVDKPGYGVASAAAYPSAGDPGIANYLYNIAPDQYDDIFVLLEREVPLPRIQPMLDVLDKLAGRRVHVIMLDGGPGKEDV
nr:MULTISPECIES: phosphoribosyltransferase family protein [Paenibacillus]